MKFSITLQLFSQKVLHAGITASLVGCFSFSALGAPAGVPAKKSIVVGLDTRPRAFDPRIIGGDANSFYIEELRFLPLIGSDPDGKMRPLVAEVLEPQGKLNWRVRLKKGVQFALGRELTAGDVVGTYNALLHPKPDFPPSPRVGDFEHVLSVTQVSKYEVLFSLSEPNAAFPSNLVIGILPVEALQEKPGELRGKGYESGPYLLNKITNQGVHLLANAKFSAKELGAKKPQITTVTFQTYTDSNTLASALVKGDVDLVQNALDSDKAFDIAQNQKSKFTVQTRPATQTTYLAFNLKDPRFQKSAFRTAVSLALNRDEIIKYVLSGFATPARGMFPPGFAFYEPQLQEPEYNLEKAKKLLDEAGFPDPDGEGPKSRMQFTIKVTTAGDRLRVAKAVAAQLKNVGLDVHVESLEFGTFYNQIDAARVDAWIAPWIGYKDPDLLHFAFATSQQSPAGGNLNHFSNEKADKLLEAGRRETNIARRKKIYKEVQLLLEQEVPYLYLWHRSCVAVLRKNFSNFEVYANGSFWGLVSANQDN